MYDLYFQAQNSVDYLSCSGFLLIWQQNTSYIPVFGKDYPSYASRVRGLESGVGSGVESGFWVSALGERVSVGGWVGVFLCVIRAKYFCTVWLTVLGCSLCSGLFLTSLRVRVCVLHMEI